MSSPPTIKDFCIVAPPAVRKLPPFDIFKASFVF